MLWIALYLPELPLQVSHRGLLPDLPLVISDGSTQRPIVLAANGPAREAGIQPGMPLAGARALIHDLVAQARDTGREQAALHALASWAAQFTPQVALESEGVLLEVQPSLRLFGGLSALGTRLERGAKGLGFQVVLSVAPTPLGAWLLARARAMDATVRGSIDLPRLGRKLDSLSINLADWPVDARDALARLGITTLGQCRRLPRDGVMRRFGPQLLHDLDRAYGDLPDPRIAFSAPQQFFSKIELAAELDNMEWIKLPVQQLLQELEGYLRARQQGVQALKLTFEHGRALKTELPIAVAAPQCFADDFMLLINEHLARLALSAPVQAVSLRADALLPYTPANKTLLPDRATQSMAWQQLHERLTARLPAGAIYRLVTVDDHRPEHAWAKEANAASKAAPAELPRPAWLLTSPRALSLRAGQPHYEGVLTLLTGPERIEAGWWDEAPVSRDYYIARNPRGQLCWIYLDHQLGGWYLHGFFA